MNKKSLTPEEKAKIAIDKWDSFVADIFNLALAHGTKKQKNISVNSNREMKKILQDGAAEIKASFRKYVAAEMTIVTHELNEEYAETYKAIVKDDVG